MYSEFQKYNVLIRRGYKGLSTTRENRFFKTPCKQTQPKENKHQPTTRSGMHIDNKLRYYLSIVLISSIFRALIRFIKCIKANKRTLIL